MTEENDKARRQRDVERRMLEDAQRRASLPESVRRQLERPRWPWPPSGDLEPVDNPTPRPKPRPSASAEADHQKG
jgi:hypothetical protein